MLAVSSVHPSITPSNNQAQWHKRWFGSAEYWRFQLLIWSVFSALWITASLLIPPAERDDAYVTRQIIRNILNACAGITATHFLHLLFEALATRLKGWLFRISAALAMLVTSTALVTLGSIVVLMTLPYTPGLFFARWMQAFTTIFMWTAFYFAFVNRRNFHREQLARAHLDAALKDAELRALRSQINPHFLFNSLNSLRAQIPLDLERPRETVTRLADLLRAALGSSEYRTITISQELTNVGNYLALEKLRYQTRLQTQIEVDPVAGDWPIPPFLLQGLVENAVNHGIAPREDGGAIKIRAAVIDTALHLAVVNPGRLTSKTGTTRIGLKNSQSRLHLIYGETASLDLAQTGDDEVTATLVIPRIPATADAASA